MNSHAFLTKVCLTLTTLSLITLCVSCRQQNVAPSLAAHSQDQKALAVSGEALNAKDGSGYTTLMYATPRNPDLMTELLAKGADVNAKDQDGRTALFDPISMSGDVQEAVALKVLLDHGADVNVKDNGGETPLSWAVANHDLKGIQILLAARPNNATKDAAMRAAEKYDDDDAVALLRNAGARETTLFPAIPPPKPTAIQYYVTDLGVLQGGNSKAVAINDHGQVAGNADISSRDTFRKPNTHAFLWANGKMIDIGTLGGNASTALGIDEAGRVVCSGETTTLDEYGSVVSDYFSWYRGHKSDLNVAWTHANKKQEDEVEFDCMNSRGDLLVEGNEELLIYRDDHKERVRLPLLSKRRWRYANWDPPIPRAMNDNGMIAFHEQASGSEGASYYLRGRMHDLSIDSDFLMVINGKQEQVVASFGISGINNQNEIIGDVDGQALVWKGARRYELESLYGLQCAAHGINDRGQVVGIVSDDVRANRPQGHACLWQRGKIQDLNTLIPSGSGWTLEDATAINNRGQIVGYGLRNGHTRAFLLTPVKQ